jgi:hypothetical protein
MSRGRTFLDAEIAALRERNRRGESVNALARETHVTWGTMGQILLRAVAAAAPKPCKNPACRRAGEVLPVSEFWINRTMADHRDAVCSECRKLHARHPDTAPPRPGRDLPPYDFTCPTCGMGVDQKGRRFERMQDALDCCKNLVEIPEERRPKIKLGRPRKKFATMLGLEGSR